MYKGSSISNNEDSDEAPEKNLHFLEKFKVVHLLMSMKIVYMINPYLATC